MAILLPSEAFETQLFLSRAAVVALASSACIAVWRRGPRLVAQGTDFFFARSGPVNLAIARIAIFAVLYDQARSGKFQFYASLPHELHEIPLGSEWLFALVPVSVETTAVLQLILRAACLAAIAGIATNLSAIVATFCALYVLVMPHLFGHVGHSSHQLIWFAGILAVSPCGRALSVDRLAFVGLQALRKRYTPVAPSSTYTLALHSMWMLLGLVYFFPGFWKLWSTGVAWFTTDSLKFFLYKEWHRYTWLPAFRIDDYEGLLHLAAAGTIAFELSFLFLMFSTKTRLLALLLGGTFHGGIQYFMKIGFKALVKCYVILIDWAGVFGWIGHRLVRRTWTLAFSDRGPVQRAIRAWIHELDLLGVTKIDVPIAEARDDSSSRRRVVALATISAVSIFLFIGNAALGFSGEQRAWPLSCYPAFDSLAIDRDAIVVVQFEDESGALNELRSEAIEAGLRTSALVRLLRYFVRVEDHDRRARKLKLWWQLLQRERSDLVDVRSVAFFRVVQRASPNHWGEPPLERLELARISF